MNNRQRIIRQLQVISYWSEEAAKLIMDHLSDEPETFLDIDQYYSEYESATQCVIDLRMIDQIPGSRIHDADNFETRAREYLETQTTVLSFPGGIVIKDF